MLHTILGITCYDPYFRDALFENSTAAVRDSYFVSEHDSVLLKAISKDRSLKSAFEEVGNKICTHKPCPSVAPEVLSVIGAALLDESFRKEFFKDPIATARKHGLVLRYPETYVLATLMDGQNGERLKKAITDLADRLPRLTEKAEVLTAA